MIGNLSATLLQTRHQVLVNEGEEPSEFWTILGGYKQYACADCLKKVSKLPRLFECTFSTGNFNVELISDFNQDDLCIDYVYILDSRNEIYVWIGSNASNRLYKTSMKAAVEYSRLTVNVELNLSTYTEKFDAPSSSQEISKNSNSEKPLKDSSYEIFQDIYCVRAGHEPLMFLCHFHGWIGLPDLNDVQVEKINPQDVQLSLDY